MLSIDKKILMFNVREVHFSDKPYDIKNCDFINFRYCKNKLDTEGFIRKKELTNVIDLTQEMDTIWKNMDNKNVRYWIKRAEREGIKIRINEGYDQFYKIYRSFMKKKGLRSIFDRFGVWSTDLETMKKHGTLFTAEYNGEMLAGTVYLEDDNHIEAWIGASKRLDADRKIKTLIACANRLLDWEAIKYAKAKNIKEFDLGGLWSEGITNKDESKNGVNKFKLSFGGKTVTRYSYQKFYSKKYRFFYQLYCLKNYRRKAT